MIWWTITGIGGVAFTAPLALSILGLLALARRWRLCLIWSALFAVAMLVIIASKVAFLGWGIGLRAIDFAGFSGHAARAAAVFPVAFFLLCQDRPRPWQFAGVALGILGALLISVSRVEVGAHSVSEASLGFALGLGAAALFMRQAGAGKPFHASALLLVVSLVIMVPLPKGEAQAAQGWMEELAMSLSGKDRVYSRQSWQPALRPAVRSCADGKFHFPGQCS